MPLRTLDVLNPSDSLFIFDQFQVDNTLPKHRRNRTQYTRSKGGSNTIGSDEDVSAEFEEDSGWVGSPRFSLGPNLIRTLAISPQQPPSLWTRFKSWFQRKPKDPKGESVEEVFVHIKTSASELQEWQERDQALEDMLTRAKQGSQHDMLKRLEAEKGVRKFENMLYVKGLKRMLTEAQLLEFTAKCERGLCLDWVSNFVRPIPPEVIDKKVQCDEAHIFDNYVVLHFDPKNKATTQESRTEAQRARDPILFGVLRGSRKLYFVGDWVDEECNLTFQQIIDKLGRPLELSEDQSLKTPL